MSATSERRFSEPTFPTEVIPTFSEMSAYLTGLGFRRHRVPESHNYFDRPDTRALVALPDMDDDQRLWPPNLGSIRSTLDAFGIVPRHEFNSWLERNATRPTKTGTHD